MIFPRPIKRLLILEILLVACPAFAQQTYQEFTIQGSLIPLESGTRLDDNVFREISASDAKMDEIISLDFGGKVEASWDNWRGELTYEGGGDSYLTYDILDNIRNDGVVSLNFTLGNLSFYSEKEIFLRNSHYDDFDYTEDGFLAGIQWNPTNPLNVELKYKNLSRVYGSQEDPVRTQNFTDNSVDLNGHMEMDDRWTLGLEGNYTDREFNRSAVVELQGFPSNYVDATYLQDDQSYGLVLSAQVYIESILQNLSIQHERTDSNSYGFSNTVDSFSWAAVVKPTKNFYLQLFVRLYEKTYDQIPLINPDLNVGFADEDSQDLLSVKTTWEFEPLWSAGFTYSRMKTESTQLGEYYIKNVEALQVEKKF